VKEAEARQLLRIARVMKEAEARQLLSKRAVNLEWEAAPSRSRGLVVHGLEDTDQHVRLEAIARLRGIANEFPVLERDAVLLLAGSVLDDEPIVRVSALEGIAEISQNLDNDLVELCVNALEDTDCTVRSAVIHVLNTVPIARAYSVPRACKAAHHKMDKKQLAAFYHRNRYLFKLTQHNIQETEDDENNDDSDDEGVLWDMLWSIKYNVLERHLNKANCGFVILAMKEQLEAAKLELENLYMLTFSLPTYLDSFIKLAVSLDSCQELVEHAKQLFPTTVRAAKVTVRTIKNTGFIPSISVTLSVTPPKDDIFPVKMFADDGRLVHIFTKPSTAEINTDHLDNIQFFSKSNLTGQCVQLRTF